MHGLHEGWGAILAAELKDAGLSQRQLAKLVGVDQSTISRIVAGKRAPDDDLKWLICGVLQRRPDEVFPWPRVIPPKPMLESAA